MRRESIPVPLRLGLSGPAAVHAATLGARQFAENAGIDGDFVARVVIVVEEVVTNLYDHGQLSVDDEFAIELSLDDGEITLVVTDAGTPFDIATAKLDDEVPRRGGGAGLKLVRAWASHIAYETLDGRNRLEVRLRRPAGSE